MDILHYILSKLNNNINTYLLCVVKSEGSSPGRAGFKMAVAADGTFSGTVGGGIMEFKMVEKVKDLLDRQIHSLFLQEQYHDKVHSKNQSGMICSGSQIIAFVPLLVKDISLLKNLISSDNTNLLISEKGITTTNIAASGFTYTSETEWQYSESTHQKPVIHILGGGHCGLALSQLMNFLGFYIHIYDNREQLNTLEDNVYADEKHIVPYDTIGESIKLSNADYMVIMTIGYRTDKIVLKQLIHKPVKYLGLLGSVQKKETLFAELKTEGFSEQLLSLVHAPTGINIESKTTQEIAVSIAAEIIRIKNQK